MAVVMPQYAPCVTEPVLVRRRNDDRRHGTRCRFDALRLWVLAVEDAAFVFRRHRKSNGQRWRPQQRLPDASSIFTHVVDGLLGSRSPSRVPQATGATAEEETSPHQAPAVRSSLVLDQQAVPDDEVVTGVGTTQTPSTAEVLTQCDRLLGS